MPNSSMVVSTRRLPWEESGSMAKACSPPEFQGRLPAALEQVPKSALRAGRAFPNGGARLRCRSAGGRCVRQALQCALRTVVRRWPPFLWPPLPQRKAPCLPRTLPPAASVLSPSPGSKIDLVGTGATGTRQRGPAVPRAFGFAPLALCELAGATSFTEDMVCHGIAVIRKVGAALPVGYGHDVAAARSLDRHASGVGG
ncbi:hypothetical protein ACVWWJ_002666 [Luteibacter sp. HA06]